MRSHHKLCSAIEWFSELIKGHKKTGSFLNRSDWSFLNVPVMRYPVSNIGNQSSITLSASGGNFEEKKQWNSNEIKSYINERVEELQKIIKLRTAFSFVLIATFADFLFCAISNQRSSSILLKKSFNDFLKCNHIDSLNNDNISSTLTQILRNGAIHNLSANPPTWKKEDLKNLYRVIMAHKIDCGKYKNLSVINDQYLIVIAEDMLDYLHRYVNMKCDDPTSMENIEQWFNEHPPIYPLTPASINLVKDNK
ncbi:hypothetical protein [Acidithiobacillus sulfurivorans]|uniref:DUF4145 domain-containing protein n=1 Tax=Acidithiobacillus sulfurivorans TaxID=1958756 RepID=A0ABS6A033_9PROT|nr:hypothetical protein [Acidithiobacillus sulfurivorans]MBU2760832.1 hypothetical protein [Acidithiobacillus sulfurivorans]